MDKINMREAVDHERRRCFGDATLTFAAVELGGIGNARRSRPLLGHGLRLAQDRAEAQCLAAIHHGDRRTGEFISFRIMDLIQC
jgi:hypothetical protein